MGLCHPVPRVETNYIGNNAFSKNCYINCFEWGQRWIMTRGYTPWGYGVETPPPPHWGITSDGLVSPLVL
jgi:hypothetical protein